MLPSLFNQYVELARCPPQVKNAADPVVVKLTTKSAVLLPVVGPEWTGPTMLSIVPPNIVRLRETPPAASAPATVRLLAPGTANVSDGKAITFGAGKDGHNDETPPPPLAHRSTVSVAL